MESNAEVMRLDTPGNTHLPSPLLPVEILHEIFIQCAYRCFRAHKDCVAQTVPCWVNLSYVCRYWRQVALECPTLWTYVFVISQRWTEELLRRSKQASLKISVDVLWLQLRLGPRLQHNLEKLMDHVERIEELCLTLVPAQHIIRVFSKLSSSAPRLRTLSVTVHQMYGGEHPLQVQGDTPVLCTLELSGCPVLLHSFRLNALTSLRLSNVPRRSRQNMEQFLATLKCMPSLKDLYLSDPFPDGTRLHPSTTYKASEKVDLPRLSRIFLGAPTPTIVLFLSRVIIPLKANLWLELFDGSTPSLGTCKLFCTLLAQRYDQAGSTPIIRSVVLDGACPYPIVRFTCSANEHNLTPLSCGVWESDFPFQIVLNAIRMDIITDIFRSVPLSNVQSLWVTNPPIQSTFWTTMLGYLPDLRHIKLHGGSMPDFSVLSPVGRRAGRGVQNDNEGPSRPLVPLLEELWLDEISFTFSSDCRHFPQACLTRDPRFGALSMRQGSRGRLTMIQCEMSEYTVDAVVVWGDGDVRILSERVCRLIVSDGEEGTEEGEGSDSQGGHSDDEEED